MGASGSSITMAKLFVPAGADCHCNTGERSAPSHVYRAGIDLPLEKLELRTQSEVRAWPCARPEGCESRTVASRQDDETIAMARIRLRQGPRSNVLNCGFIAPLPGGPHNRCSLKPETRRNRHAQHRSPPPRCESFVTALETRLKLPFNIPRIARMWGRPAWLFLLDYGFDFHY